MRLGAVGPAALEGVHALLAAALPYERFSAGLTREKLFEGFRPDDRSTVLAAVEGADLVGVMQSVVRPAARRAWLGLFAVAPGARRRGVASALLAHVAAEWARAGAQEAGVLAIPAITSGRGSTRARRPPSGSSSGTASGGPARP